jgi:hypothetical protein
VSDLIDFCTRESPAPKRMLPKLISLLQYCHETDQKSSRFYFDVQKTIQNHYVTEGSSCFFDDAEKVYMIGDICYETEEEAATAQLEAFHL